MSNLATNPTTGETLFYDGNAWVPARVAENPQTGERIAWDGQGWRPIKAQGELVGQKVADVVKNTGQPAELTFDNTLANFFQGATFGYGDELVAGARDLLGIEDYDSALANHRRLVEQGREASPGVAMAAELVGGVMVPGVGFAKAAQAPSLIGKGLGLAGAGGLTGAVTGFGIGEGGFDSRLDSAKQGGAIGALATPALAGLASVGAKGGKALYNIVGPQSDDMIERAAGNKILQALERNGMTTDDAAKALADLRASGVTGTALADLGENLRQFTAAAARVPGKGVQVAADFADTRQAGQAGRLISAFEDALGTTKALAPFLDDVSARQMAAAKPLYAAADAIEVPTAALADFFQDGTFQRALKRGLQIATLEEGAGAVPRINFDDLANTLPPSVPTRWLDLAKRGLDADILASRVSDPTYSRALGSFKRRFLSTLDTLNPTYKSARSAWAGEADLLDAADLGRQALTLSPDELAKAVGQLTPSTTAAFRVGMLDYVKGIIEKSPDAADKVKRIFGNERTRNLLGKVLSPDEYDMLDRLLSAEREKFKTLFEIGGNSRTALRQMADADFKVPASALPPFTLKGLAGNWIKRGEGYAQGLNERIAESALKRMTETETLKIERILEALKQLDFMNAERAANPLRNAPAYATGLGGISLPSLFSQ